MWVGRRLFLCVFLCVPLLRRQIVCRLSKVFQRQFSWQSTVWAGLPRRIRTFPSRHDTVCGKRPRQKDGEFTSGRVIILIRLRHEGLVAAASITVCLLRLLEVLDRDPQCSQQQPYPKAPWPGELPPRRSSIFMPYKAAPSLNPDLRGRQWELQMFASQLVSEGRSTDFYTPRWALLWWGVQRSLCDSGHNPNLGLRVLDLAGKSIWRRLHVVCCYRGFD